MTVLESDNRTKCNQAPVRWQYMGMQKLHNHIIFVVKIKQPTNFRKMLNISMRDNISITVSLHPAIWHQHYQWMQPSPTSRNAGLLIKAKYKWKVVAVIDTSIFIQYLKLSTAGGDTMETNVRSCFLPTTTWGSYWLVRGRRGHPIDTVW